MGAALLIDRQRLALPVADGMGQALRLGPVRDRFGDGAVEALGAGGMIKRLDQQGRIVDFAGELDRFQRSLQILGREIALGQLCQQCFQPVSNDRALRASGSVPKRCYVTMTETSLTICYQPQFCEGASDRNACARAGQGAF